MTPEQQGLIEDIATRFIAAAPQDMQWTELQVDVSMLNSISGFAATAVDKDDKETPFFIDDATDKKILHALSRMREDMAHDVPGRGAWYIMSLRIPREGKPYVDFDYFTKPTFGVHVGDGAYKQDLKSYPRSEDNVPEWLGGKPRAKPQPKPKEAPKPESPAEPAKLVATATAAGAVVATAETDAPETTPPVASEPDITPPIAPPGDIQLNAEGMPVNADEPMDEELAAEENVEIAPLPNQPQIQPTPGVGGAPNATPVPEPEDDTPWYENPA